MTRWGILSHSFFNFLFKASKLVWCAVETLFSKIDQIAKPIGFKSVDDGGHSSFDMKEGIFSASHSWVFLAPCAGAVLLERPTSVF